MINGKEKPGSVATAGQCNGNLADVISTSQDNTSPDEFQAVMLNCRLSELQAQAEQQMKRHPNDHGRHFLIWLSCNIMKTRMPWPGDAIPFRGEPCYGADPLTAADEYGLEARG